MTIETDPPAYQPASAPPKRSIQDLRAQIIANGSVIRQRYNQERSSDDHIELVVAQKPASSNGNPDGRNFSEKQPAFSWTRTQQQQPSAASASSDAQPQHYACLLQRSSSRKIRIIHKSDPKDTVEEALEALLVYTEMVMHDLIFQYGNIDSGQPECCVM
ncbi:hypothetical protein MBLNU230_g0392t1 [Neophaeotheca triangularis]